MAFDASVVSKTPRVSKTSRQRIAVVGTGIAGLSAAWLLDQAHDITVYETENRPGGHSNTVDVALGGRRAAVDTGFIVYNDRNYPNLVALFEHLGVPTKASNMSFSASLDDGAFEYAGSDINGLLGQRSNVVRPRFWRMIRDVLRFYAEAPKLLDTDLSIDVTLGDYLEANGYSSAFIDDHILPMSAAIWSTTAPEMRAFPVAAFVRFFFSHGLLSLSNRPQWRTVEGGSREYVRRLTASFADRIRLGAGVRRIHRHGSRVLIDDAQGNRDVFDHVVIATHADEALGLLADPTETERRLLGAFAYTPNETILHSDETLMPKRRSVWSSWNYIGDGAAASAKPLCVTYWMNRLQGIDPALPLFVTLNPDRAPREDLVHRRFSYMHPLFDRVALRAQQDLWQLQGVNNSWFCGSYFGYGFHEDALQSGLAVGEMLGAVRRPWQVANESGRIAAAPLNLVAAE